MSDRIIGLMWNKSEGDILNETLSSALPMVDDLLVADHMSSDNSWDIIQERRSEFAFISQSSHDPRQLLLDKAVEMYGRNIWIQIIESYMINVDTDVRAEIDSRALFNGEVLWWVYVEAFRLNWGPEDELFPNWDKSITEVMPLGMILEQCPLTFRPHSDVRFTDRWRPWPAGLNGYMEKEQGLFSKKAWWRKQTPLFGHYNIRGHKHYSFKQLDKTVADSRRFMAFDAAKTHPGRVFPLSREGWIGHHFNE